MFKLINFFKATIVGFSVLILCGCGNDNSNTLPSDTELIAVKSTVDNDFYKYQTVSEMYTNTLLSLYNTPDFNKLDYLYNYSDKGLKEVILFAKEHTNNTSEPSKNNPECDIAISKLYLVPNRTYETSDVIQIDDKILSNGNIRSNILIYKDDASHTPYFNTIKDFTLVCKKENCKIADIYDSKGTSTKKSILEFCK